MSTRLHALSASRAIGRSNDLHIAAIKCTPGQGAVLDHYPVHRTGSMRGPCLQDWIFFKSMLLLLLMNLL
jgi:hypothetical protein